VYIYGSYRKNKTGVPFFLEHNNEYHYTRYDTVTYVID